MKITVLKAVLSEIVNIKSYVDEDCANCGRHRVELFTLSTGNQYHVCEKCGWIREMKRYLFDRDLSCDEYIKGKTYLREVLSREEEPEGVGLVWVKTLNREKEDKGE